LKSPKGKFQRRKNGLNIINATCIFCFQQGGHQGVFFLEDGIKRGGRTRVLGGWNDNNQKYLRLYGYDTVKGTEIDKLEKVCSAGRCVINTKALHRHKSM